MSCPARYGVMLRHPMTTMESYFKFLFSAEHRPDAVQAVYDTMLNGSVDLSMGIEKQCCEGGTEPLSAMLRHTDNYTVRMLGGSDPTWKSHSLNDDMSIGMANLEEAKKVLDKMDVV